MRLFRKIRLSRIKDPETLKQLIVDINEQIVIDTGEPFMIINEDQLDSAIGQVFQSWYTEEQAIAALFKSLILNHPFMNGNKRVAFAVATHMGNTLLNFNEIKNLTYIIASEGGSAIEVNEIANILFGTEYEVYKPRVDEYLDYEDDHDFDDVNLNESSEVAHSTVEIEMSPRILLEQYEEDFLEEGYDYTAISRVYATVDLDEREWDLTVVIDNEEILWDLVESYEIEKYVITQESKEDFEFLRKYID